MGWAQRLKGVFGIEIDTCQRCGGTLRIVASIELAALVPKPRVHLNRFHGVFPPNSSCRARVTPARRGRGSQHTGRTDRVEAPTPAERRAAMNWAQRLKRVFGIGIHTCAACGGTVRIIACIEDPEVIEKILAHLDQKTTESPGWPPPCRAPQQRGLFD